MGVGDHQLPVSAQSNPLIGVFFGQFGSFILYMLPAGVVFISYFAFPRSVLFRPRHMLRQRRYKRPLR